MGDVTEESLGSRGVGEMGLFGRLERASRGLGPELWKLRGLEAEGAGVESALTGQADAQEAIALILTVSLIQARS